MQGYNYVVQSNNFCTEFIFP